jgi:hypothetical protein
MCSFIGKIERGFDFLGFQFSLEGMTISKKSVRKFAENIVLKLISSQHTAGQITPGGSVIQSVYGSIYDTMQLRDKTTKGDLPIPETVSAYIQRWMRWVKSIYEKDIKTELSKT